ncbi:MAG: hypothetical protein ACI8ZN_002117 [Bacteroidia bacterium]|jgi:hypothetical protein
MNLKEPNEVFELETDDCLTFDAFTANLKYNLEGFCGAISNFTLTLSSPLPAGWDINFNQTIPKGITTGVNIPEEYCTDCLYATAPHDAPEPEPCKCIKMNLSYSVEPCPNAPDDCEPLTIETVVEVCCSCDVRATEPID